MVHGWADQWWTLARIKTLIGHLLHVSYTVEGTWLLLKRHGWSWQQPGGRSSGTPRRSRSGRRRPGRG
ncbi:winged helix-turn-helix domain-containing protein [Streptomyces sp. NPDC059989]|uniref:helix-turn-helix domain-containing protein n=1 Tax=Streptomyces sp. NPDC059989 TaxID=3347026 RepID=UPI0036CD7B24